jgi:hypothetical protein
MICATWLLVRGQAKTSGGSKPGDDMIGCVDLLRLEEYKECRWSERRGNGVYDTLRRGDVRSPSWHPSALVIAALPMCRRVEAGRRPGKVAARWFMTPQIPMSSTLA